MKPPKMFLAAVEDFEKARDKMDTFISKNEALYRELLMLTDRYNTSLNQVKEIYKDNMGDIGPTYGEFKLSERKTVDPYALAERIPLDVLEAHEILVMEPRIQLKEYRKAVASGLIDDDVADFVESVKSVSVLGPKAR